MKVHVLEVIPPPVKIRSLQHFPQPQTTQACTPSHMHTCLCMTTESRGHPWVATGSNSGSSYRVHDGWRGMKFPEIFIYRFVPSPTYITTYINLTHKKHLFLKSLIFKELEKECDLPSCVCINLDPGEMSHKHGTWAGADQWS